MGGWIQYAPDAWQWSPDHDFGEQKEWPRNKYKSHTGRLKVGTRIAFVEYPQKGPRQMMVILEKLQEFGEGGITIGMFWQKLEGQLNTKQDVDRVYKHYHREMVDKGFIRMLS